MKKQVCYFSLLQVLVLICLSTSGFTQTKKIYIALDDHTDYMYSSNEQENQQAFLTSLDYYLNLADATDGLPSDYQSRWNCDGNFWLWTYEKNRSPAAFDRLISRIRSGHISAPLNALVSCYGGQPSEAVLRGMYYPGKLERRYNLKFPVALAMENATLPYGLGALWAGAGAKYSWRGLCGCASLTPYARTRPDIYWWQGLDNSRILMKWNYFYPYEGASIGDYQEARFLDRALHRVENHSDFQENWPYPILGLFGKGGDDLMTLTDDFVKFAMNNSNANRRIIVSNEEDFFRDFETNHGNEISSFAASFGNEWDLLCASMAEVSASVKRSVEQLRTAEALQTLVAVRNPDFMREQTAERDEAWMNLGLYWEHAWTADAGSRTERANWQRKLAGQVSNYVNSVETNAKAALGAMIPNPGNYQRFYAFNALSWTRTDFADIPYDATDPVYVIDVSLNTEVPSQIITLNGKRFLRILAADLPPVGYKVFEIRPGTPGQFSAAAKVEGNTIENAFYRLTVGTNGAITSLIDKTRNQQEFARAIDGKYINDLGASAGTIEVENSGPVSVTVKITATAPLRHTTAITLFRDSDRIDIRNEINQNFSDVYTWSYNFNLDNPETWHEEVGNILQAKTNENGGHYSARGGRLDWLTLNHFADMTGSNNLGITLSNADCYFMQLGKSDILNLDTSTPRIAPLVGGQVDGPRLGIPDQGGDSKFLQRFALRTHNAYSAQQALRFSLEHQNPLSTHFVTNGTGYPETSFSLLTISDPDIFLWTLKPAEEGIEQGIIARTFNVSTQSGTASLQLTNPIDSAQQTTHIETNIQAVPVNDGKLELSYSPQQYLTHRVKLNTAEAFRPPAISLHGPTNGASFAAQSAVTITTNVQAGTNAIAKVEFYDGRIKLGETSSRPFQLSLTSLTTGQHSIYARVVDTAGHSATSTVAQINISADPATAVSVSAASYRPVFLAAGAIASAFGTELATTTQSATGLPLPTELGGTTVSIIDSLGQQHVAPLFYVSPAQVNYQIPAAVATGTAQVIFRNANQVTRQERLQITPTTPGLFSASADGQGLAAATITRVRNDGTRIEEPVVQFDAAQNKFVAAPVDLGTATDQVFLILYGTGMRMQNLNAAVVLGDLTLNADYVGAQGFFVGVDQVNILLPRQLSGKGDLQVNLSIQGQTANSVQIKVK